MHDTVEITLACMFRYNLYQCTNTGKIDFKRHQLTKTKITFLFLVSLSSLICSWVCLDNAYSLYHVCLSIWLRLGSRHNNIVIAGNNNCFDEEPTRTKRRRTYKDKETKEPLTYSCNLSNLNHKYRWIHLHALLHCWLCWIWNLIVSWPFGSALKRTKNQRKG